MSNKKTPAFPRAGNEWSEMAWIEAPAEQGMTLRDYFAAKAMQCYMHEDMWSADVYKLAAKCSYELADAMLKARET